MPNGMYGGVRGGLNSPYSIASICFFVVAGVRGGEWDAKRKLIPRPV